MTEPTLNPNAVYVGIVRCPACGVEVHRYVHWDTRKDGLWELGPGDVRHQCGTEDEACDDTESQG